MTAYRTEIELGLSFSVKVPSSREREFCVKNLNDEPFDSLICKITNSTSYSPPTAFVTDMQNKIIKIKFSSDTPIGTSLNIIVQGAVAQKNITVEKNTLISDETLEAAKEFPGKAGNFLWQTLKWMFISFAGATVFLWIVSDTKVGNLINKGWSYFNAARAVEVAKNFDARIATNKHHVYETAAFTEMNASYKLSHGNHHDLKKLYQFVGNNFFVTKDLIRNPDGSFMIVDGEEAAEYCEQIGGRLLSVEELIIYLAQQYAGIENFLWPVERRADIAEWSGSKHSWDNFYVYLKEGGENPTRSKITEGKEKFIIADEDDFKFAFRCGFPEKLFVSTE